MERTILIVDDDAKFLSFLSRTLKHAGFSVLTASDGCEVPDLLSSNRIDMLLLDLQMPGMNGWEVIRKLHDPLTTAQTTKGSARPKVVVVSGRDEDEAAAFVQRLGADAYLTKQLWGKQLLATVRRVLAH